MGAPGPRFCLPFPSETFFFFNPTRLLTVVVLALSSLSLCFLFFSFFFPVSPSSLPPSLSFLCVSQRSMLHFFLLRANRRGYLLSYCNLKIEIKIWFEGWKENVPYSGLTLCSKLGVIFKIRTMNKEQYRKKPLGSRQRCINKWLSYLLKWGKSSVSYVYIIPIGLPGVMNDISIMYSDQISY